MKPTCRPCLESWLKSTRRRATLGATLRTQNRALPSSYRLLSTDTAGPMEAPAMRKLREELTSTQPCFGVRGDEIEVLVKPDDFHQRLLSMIGRARRRIIISTLYIGTEQQELVDALRSALLQNPHLRLTLISDLLRSTRESHPTPSTATLLLPLVQEFPDRVEAWFYRSPKLSGLLERVVPRRFDEGWGLWHCKWYGVDDEVILSGANLSKSYFEDRQDRYYHLTNQPTLLSYLASLLRLYSQYCYKLHPNPPPSSSPHYHIPLFPPATSSPSTSVSSSSSRPAGVQPTSRAALVWPEPQIHPRQFPTHAQATLAAFQRSWRSSARARRVDVDTWVWPMVQAGVLGMREEEEGVGRVLGAVDKAVAGERIGVDLTSGYFGLFKKYKKAVLESRADFRVVAASPQANGFYKSAGVSGLIPDAYTLLESRFHRDLVRAGREWDEEKGTGIELSEWAREGWTYHAKGIWLTPKDEPPHITPRPFATLIGSTNLSTRSLNLDVELSFLMMTSSTSLRKAMAGELDNIRGNIKRVGAKTWEEPERKVGWQTKVLVGLGVEGML